VCLEIRENSSPGEFANRRNAPCSPARKAETRPAEFAGYHTEAVLSDS
jgi:hypothetical protein